MKQYALYLYKKAIFLLLILTMIICLTGCYEGERTTLEYNHDDYIYKQYTEVEEMLRENGFENISFGTTGIRPDVEDHGEPGQVVGVYFDGEWEVEKYDRFDVDVPIVIHYLVENLTKVPLSSDDCYGRPYEEIVSAFEDAGFTEIHVQECKREYNSSVNENGVIAVCIYNSGLNYIEEFTNEDEFNADTYISICYVVYTNDAQKSSNEQNEEETRTLSVHEQNVTQMVWITETGSKYHRKSNCGRTESSYQIPIEEAKAMGYEACKKCC